MEREFARQRANDELIKAQLREIEYGVLPPLLLLMFC